MAKRRYPLSKVYGLLEPGPVVLLTTARGQECDVMPMSWHSMLEFEPPLVGCVVSDRNHSHALLRASRECVLNIPTEAIADRVVGCGNTTGATVDKFSRFGLTRRAADDPAAVEDEVNAGRGRCSARAASPVRKSEAISSFTTSTIAEES